jgi:hypothetical protein
MDSKIKEAIYGRCPKCKSILKDAISDNHCRACQTIIDKIEPTLEIIRLQAEFDATKKKISELVNGWDALKEDRDLLMISCENKIIELDATKKESEKNLQMALKYKKDLDKAIEQLGHNNPWHNPEDIKRIEELEGETTDNKS